MPDLDDQINEAHAGLEQREQEARQLESRLRKIPGVERLLPTRNYGQPFDKNREQAASSRSHTLPSYEIPSTTDSILILRSSLEPSRILH